MAQKRPCASDFRTYNIPTEPIPVFDYKDPQAEALMQRMQPVVLKNSNLVASAMKWDLKYLEENVGDGSFIVYESSSHVFKYYDQVKAQNCQVEFHPSIRRTDLKFHEFSRNLQQWQPGKKRFYLQQLLTDKVGKSVVSDFLAFNWHWANYLQKKNGWGTLTSNLLLIATEGNVTPCHYDEQHNLFSQIHGYKKFLLFPPKQYCCFYPHPVYHPHDRQSQVDFDNPDLRKFPKFADAHGYEAILEPGDVLYLPMYWWHHVESPLNCGYTVSVNFWYKAGPTGTVNYPLQDDQKMAIMRNIEKMVIEALRDVNEVGPLFQALVLGRYT